MSIVRPVSTYAAYLGASFFFAPYVFSAPANAPFVMAADTNPAGATTRNAQAVVTDIKDDQKTVSELSGKGDIVFKIPPARDAAAPKLIPAIKKLRADMNELVTVEPKFKPTVEAAQPRFLAMLTVLGDKESDNKIQSMKTSQNPAEAVQGQTAEFLTRWLASDSTVAHQTPLVDELEKLDVAHADSVPLTMLTAQISFQAASPELNKRLLAIASDEMKNPAAASIKKQLAAKQATTPAEDKPLVIAGTTPDGKSFTSADLKGKVILVDFWATWCGPCKAELPRVKKIYSDYHDKGLEILGVSNDFDVKALTGFIAKEQMPWPELFDSNAASAQQWNAVTLAQGITGIPTMYLIDRKGILRTVNGREKMEEMIPKLLAEAN